MGSGILMGRWIRTMCLDHLSAEDLPHAVESTVQQRFGSLRTDAVIAVDHQTVLDHLVAVDSLEHSSQTQLKVAESPEIAVARRDVVPSYDVAPDLRLTVTWTEPSHQTSAGRRRTWVHEKCSAELPGVRPPWVEPWRSPLATVSSGPDQSAVHPRP